MREREIEIERDRKGVTEKGREEVKVGTFITRQVR